MPDDDVFLAGVDLLRRTGAQGFQIRYSDDEQPVVWIAVSEWRVGRASRLVPAGRGGKRVFDTAAGLTPRRAVIRLLEQLLDGIGVCQHCGKPSSIIEEPDAEHPLHAITCVYAYDPELKTFRRGCEGD